MRYLTLLFLVSASYAAAQQSAADVLRISATVANNIQTAVTSHIVQDTTFSRDPQQPEDKRELPSMLVFKDGTVQFDWTEGQQARYLMEDLRQGIHILQSARTPLGIDAVALKGARDYWPKLRDISCRDKPGSRYYDLDGFEQYCPR